MAVKYVTEDEWKAMAEDEGTLAKVQMLESSCKVGGSSDAQTGAMLMHHIHKLNRIIEESPLLGFAGSDTYYLSQSSDGK